MLDEIIRQERGFVLAGLIRAAGGDFDLAEDALQDALSRALERWPVDGVPARPAAWLTTVSHRRLVDLQRRRSKAWGGGELPDVAAPEPEPEAEDPAATSGVEDDRLRLLFTCCHPALAQPAQVALALRTLGGLSTREIARAFIEPEATTAQRLVRAKKKIRDARIPYVVPRPEDFPARLAAVLSVIYFIFNEGYLATEAPGLIRPDLAREAIRLGRLVVELLPGDTEARGLLALMLLHDARRPARLGPGGELVPLDVQDRTRWDQGVIAEGVTLLDEALAAHRPGPYQIQAAIAALHARAARAEETDWRQIAALYHGLLELVPTPVVELNAAVARAMAHGPDEGLHWLDDLEARGVLAGYFLLPAARADLLRRAGRTEEARAAYGQALALGPSPAEAAFLRRRIEELEAGYLPAQRK